MILTTQSPIDKLAKRVISRDTSHYDGLYKYEEINKCVLEDKYSYITKNIYNKIKKDIKDWFNAKKHIGDVIGKFTCIEHVVGCVFIFRCSCGNYEKHNIKSIINRKKTRRKCNVCRGLPRQEY